LEMRHDCGGFATCSTCRILIVEGLPNLTEIDLDEENMLEEAELPPPFRLSCQTKVQGDVVVRVPDEAMEWSKGALRELEKHPTTFRQVIRIIVEKKARQQGIPVILPDSAIPLVEEATKALDGVADNPEAIAGLIKRVYEKE
ncbi:MAG: 2Fe-2S iron-sulfur cluster-binding protein, partial [Nitrospiria bacterium]